MIGALVRPLEIGLDPQHRSIAQPEPRGELPIVTDLATADDTVRVDAGRPHVSSVDKQVGALMAPAAAEVHAEIEAGPVVVNRSRRWRFERQVSGGCDAATFQRNE